MLSRFTPNTFFLAQWLITAVVLVNKPTPSVGSPSIRSRSKGPNRPNMPTVESMLVNCGRSGMNVQIKFDSPFRGIIYSKGSFDDAKCNYVTERSSGEREYRFLVPVEDCGTSENANSDPEEGFSFQNTIIIQNDPVIQEVWDVAQTLGCSWNDPPFTKSVKSKPILVQEPKYVTVDFDERSMDTMTEIRKGTWPSGHSTKGFVSVGDDGVLLVTLRDSSNEVDANVVSCIATSSVQSSEEVVDSNGCVLQSPLLTPFSKIRNPDMEGVDLIIYSQLKNLKIEKGSDLRLSCQLELCDGKCLEPCALGPSGHLTKERFKRELKTDSSDDGSKEREDIISRVTKLQVEAELTLERSEELGKCTIIKTESSEYSGEISLHFMFLVILVGMTLFYASLLTMRNYYDRYVAVRVTEVSPRKLSGQRTRIRSNINPEDV